MRNAKTIQIFLPDGNPRGVRIAEITSRTVEVMLVPRASLELAGKRKAFTGPGLYILFGNGEDEGKPSAYIGETENCLNRLRTHNKQREWTHAVVVLSKTEFLTKTHVKFLESISIEMAKKTARYRLENNHPSSRPHMRETDEADIWDFFETMQLLISTLGYPIFDEGRKAKRTNLLHCTGKDADATGEYTDDGFVVLEGSRCRRDLVSSAAPWVATRREALINEKVLEDDGTTLRFIEKATFTTPSTAAIIVLGRPANGWIEWKYDNGKTLDEAKRQN